MNTNVTPLAKPLAQPPMTADKAQDGPNTSEPVSTPSQLDTVDHSPRGHAQLQDARVAQSHRLKRTLHTSVVGAAVLSSAVTAFSAYPFVPSWTGQDADWLQQGRDDVERYAAAFHIEAPPLYQHHSGPGTISAQARIWAPRLIAVHAHGPKLFSPPALSCVLAHEVAHFCEVTWAAAPCKLPEHFPPYRSGHPFAQREFKADYLASLVCGKEAMLEALDALGLQYSLNQSSQTHPSLIDRIDVLSRSNATFFAGDTGGQNPHLAAIKAGCDGAVFEAAPRAAAAAALYVGYKWWKARRR